MVDYHRYLPRFLLADFGDDEDGDAAVKPHVVLGGFILLGLGRSPSNLPSLRTGTAESKDEQPEAQRAENLHLLLPASNEEVNLCKTIITATALDYPIPTLISLNKTFNTGGLLGGGSHIAKITGVLEWLQAQDASRDNDLVLMMDAYGSFDYYDNARNQQAHLEADIWFQLRKDTLISRYHSINAAANKRLSDRLGKAYDAEGIRQTIIFGSGKRCAPNQVHTVACYPMPETPLPDDVYGTNTDTIMGRNKYTSLRQRWLNSGYVVGPVKDMREMFRRAQAKVDAIQDHPEWDNGSRGADFMYHGSDQSIFNTILGEQEFQREVMRRRHLTSLDKARGKLKVPPSKIEGTIIDDPLNPSFTHEPMEQKAGKPDEFSIGLDYFSELGQQTVNSEEDSRYIRHNGDIQDQAKDRTGHFDCPNRATPEIPADISKTEPPISQRQIGEADQQWSEVPLYTNLCLDRIPVMIHHNGDKGLREAAWPRMWVQPHARKFMAAVVAGQDGEQRGGAFSDGQYVSFGQLCPREMEQELFRDLEG
ncbi:uncharacterized protein LTR77_001306 [Saxophila tyrrhenica]|uniref:Uncharacterized protein n=1 Tax=Saxophila tyrrhenica TaxID=1690608 RepID=A0AAV9PKF7_9PEZI|nr:hypothetical protein LTR77_001306 [Saxophila tyrrhenica]